MTMGNVPAGERPRERLARLGADALSLRELLAVILGAGPRGAGCLGMAGEILGRNGRHATADAEERAFFTALQTPAATALAGIKGLGPVRRAQLCAAFELGRRYAGHLADDAHHGARSDDPPRLSALERQALSRIGGDLRTAAREWLGFVPVAAGGRVGAFCLVERGVRTHVNIDPKELFAAILAVRPQAVLVAHNHPSGRAKPSAEDHELTRWLAAMLDALGIAFLGHWIVTGAASHRIA